MGIESTDSWVDIVRELSDWPLKVIATRYGVTPGEISAAMVRTGCRRRPVRNDRHK